MIGDLIGDWLKGILIDGIMGNLSGLFNTVNTKVGEIASDVGTTPQAWNGGIFSMLQSLSETVIVPIAAAILALVMCYELIEMIVEKNNMHDFDSSMFFRWMFKSAFAILIVTNTWNIVMGVFDATQAVVNQSAGVIIGETSIDFDTLLPDLESRLEAMDIGPLLGLWFQTLVVGLTMNILSICIFLVTYGRMIEIYAVTALGPIPLATLGNAEWRGMGQNYLKSLLALGFQAFLIMVVVGIYAVLIQEIGTAEDISGAIWGCMGYTVLLCFCLFKTGSISKAVFTAQGKRLIEEPQKYHIIYADPPWRYECKRTGAAEHHYPTMSIDELCALPVERLAEKDCLLFLWATFPQLPERHGALRLRPWPLSG